MPTPKPLIQWTCFHFNRVEVLCALAAFALTPVTEAHALPLDADEPSVDSDEHSVNSDEPSVDSDKTTERRHSLGSSLFVLANPFFTKEESPAFYQLNYKYMITPKDGLSLEAITWKYHAPLGIPYGKTSKDQSHKYPGAVQAYGIGVAYQRFIWKGAYAAAHVTPLRQIYLDEKKKKIQAGFQLFMTFRLGYHFSFFDDRLFLEPSIAITTWPINTNLPESFAEQEDKWPSYFLAEPGLHFGVNF